MQIAVKCAFDKVVALEELKPNPRNPNQHPPEQISLLAKIMRAQGWRNPIVVSKRSGFVVSGHGRLLAARELNLKSAPVDFQTFKTDEDELAHLIADNRIAELADLNRSMLRDIFEELDSGAFDMDLTGFDNTSLEELMTAAPPEEFPSVGDDIPVNFECPKCGYKWSGKAAP